MLYEAIERKKIPNHKQNTRQNYTQSSASNMANVYHQINKALIHGIILNFIYIYISDGFQIRFEI